MYASNLDGNLESWIPANKKEKNIEQYVWTTSEEKQKKHHEAYEPNKRIKDSTQLPKESLFKISSDIPINRPIYRLPLSDR